MPPDVDRRDFLRTAGASAATTLVVGSTLMQTGGTVAEAAAILASCMSNSLISIDLTKYPRDQEVPVHNRWYPASPQWLR